MIVVRGNGDQNACRCLWYHNKGQLFQDLLYKNYTKTPQNLLHSRYPQNLPTRAWEPTKWNGEYMNAAQQTEPSYGLSPRFVTWHGSVAETDNRREYDRLLAKRNKICLESFGNTHLYHSPGYYFMLDESNQELLFYVKYSEHTVSGNKCATQTELWRQKSSIVTKGITERVFWHYLYPRFDAVMSDQDHTDFGKAFWEQRVAEAFANGPEVAFFNMVHKTSLPIESDVKFRNELKKFYGDEDRYTGWRIVISKKVF